MRQQHQQIQEDPRPEDALDERGSYDNDPAGQAPGQVEGSVTDDPDTARGTADRGDLADASHADAVGDRPDHDGVPEQDGGARRIDGAQRPEFHEPAPVPTAFGATSVGGAVASSALAGDRRDPREEELARSGDGVAEDRIDGIDDDSGTAATTGAANRSPADDSVAESYPTMAGSPSGDSRTTTDGSLSGTGGSTMEGQPAAAAFLEPETVQGFRDRWREVQLRFVDDPSGAAADAQRLVEESVEALTAALAAQRADLGLGQGDGATDGSTDTEQLRITVRRHREFLDRILGR
ncbi:hypothetical protein [Plantactinospora sonchi]|uniref:Uncharacterized protein n=1 Tax=Plantactinospora sonchi TaxID=1544735 RepID=A0ABU7RLE5_9ACTN